MLKTKYYFQKFFSKCKQAQGVVLGFR